jgi:hypothetical protein
LKKPGVSTSRSLQGFDRVSDILDAALTGRERTQKNSSSRGFAVPDRNTPTPISSYTRKVWIAAGIGALLVAAGIA